MKHQLSSLISAVIAMTPAAAQTLIYDSSASPFTDQPSVDERFGQHISIVENPNGMGRSRIFTSVPGDAATGLGRFFSVDWPDTLSTPSAPVYQPVGGTGFKAGSVAVRGSGTGTYGIVGYPVNPTGGWIRRNRGHRRVEPRRQCAWLPDD